MKIGTEQFNTFDTFSLDCWKDRVYYEGQEFPAGHFATEILNFAGEARDPLLERLCTLITLVNQAASAGKGEGADVLVELRPLMKGDCFVDIHLSPILLSGRPGGMEQVRPGNGYGSVCSGLRHRSGTFAVSISLVQ